MWLLLVWRLMNLEAKFPVPVYTHSLSVSLSLSLKFFPSFSLNKQRHGRTRIITIIYLLLERIQFLLAQMVKNLPVMQQTRVQSPGQEDPLEKEMATHSSILAWRIPWTEEPGGLQFMGSQRVKHDWVINTQTHTPTHTQLGIIGSSNKPQSPAKHTQRRFPTCVCLQYPPFSSSFSPHCLLWLYLEISLRAA